MNQFPEYPIAKSAKQVETLNQVKQYVLKKINDKITARPKMPIENRSLIIISHNEDEGDIDPDKYKIFVDERKKMGEDMYSKLFDACFKKNDNDAYETFVNAFKNIDKRSSDRYRAFVDACRSSVDERRKMDEEMHSKLFDACCKKKDYETFVNACKGKGKGKGSKGTDWTRLLLQYDRVYQVSHFKRCEIANITKQDCLIQLFDQIV